MISCISSIRTTRRAPDSLSGCLRKSMGNQKVTRRKMKVCQYLSKNIVNFEQNSGERQPKQSFFKTASHGGSRVCKGNPEALKRWRTSARNSRESTATGELVICSDCTRASDFRPIRIAVGDAILDGYRRGYGRDLVYTNNSINSISKRIESAVYRVVADGLFNAHVRCQK